MAEKYLFLGSGSEKDPGFNDVFVDGLPYKEFMKNQGVIVVDKMIESCHGCYDIMSNYSRQMQQLADNGSRVVAVLQGGLLFGLPSIQATQTTFPIISQPLDLVAYSAFMVPSGHAAIASVGVDDGTNRQVIKSLTLAERILNLDIPEVAIFASERDIEKLKGKLNLLRVESLSYNPLGFSGLGLVYGIDYLGDVPAGSFAIRADSDENVKNWQYLKTTEERHHQGEYNNVISGQVRGLDNLAMFAAKVISLQRPDVRKKIKEAALKKREDYRERNLLKKLVGC